MLSKCKKKIMPLILKYIKADGKIDYRNEQGKIYYDVENKCFVNITSGLA